MELKQQLIKDIELLPENILLDISSVIKEYVALNARQFTDVGEKRRAMFGCMKGKMWISDDFDAPLDELKEYME
jgi:hypothetical protein